MKASDTSSGKGRQATGTAIPVDLLRPGVYIVELDRPWIETPFLFQGFRITTEDELKMLQRHCRFVYADLKRSHEAAVQALRQDAEARRQRRKQGVEGAAARRESSKPKPELAQETPHHSTVTEFRSRLERPPEHARKNSLGSLTESTPYPDRERFATLVQHAHAVRGDAHNTTLKALDDARNGDNIDAASARSAAEEIAATVMEDSTAALWLTHLQDQDHYLASHSVNVCVLAVAVGHHLGMPRGQLFQLGLGALLHSVGRVFIPRRILDKAGPLEQHEYDLVRRYPEEGYRLVCESGGVPPSARAIVRQHHERWSGHGYPDGIFGEDIPRMALITGIADAYDAMISDRPYRAAMSPEQALHILYEGAEREFGTTIVQAFMRVIGAFPIGCQVELDNGSIGMVVGLKPGAGLWPTVMMLRTPAGEPYDKRLLLNLAASDQARDELRARRIRRARTPQETGISTFTIVAQEFGLSASA